MLGANDKRTQKTAIELTSFFLAQLKQQVASGSDENVIATIPFILKDTDVLNSEERLLRIFDELEKTRDNQPLRDQILNQIWELTRNYCLILRSKQSHIHAASLISDTNALPKNVQYAFCHRFTAHLIDIVDTRSASYEHLIVYCRLQSYAFQSIVSELATRMQRCPTKSQRTTLQTTLEQFLDAVRCDMRPSDFRQLYAERMRPLVQLLSATPSTACVGALDGILMQVYAADVEQFVVLVTHHPRWLSWLDRLPLAL